MRHIPGAQVCQVAVFPSELGWMAVLGRGDTLLELTFGHDSPRTACGSLRGVGELSHDEPWRTGLVERLQAFADGKREDFSDVPLELDDLTDFQRRVVAHCRAIPFGATRTYGELASLAGSPRAARAVGNCMASNRTPLVVPCHRVVGSGGGLGGYSAPGGVRAKLRLLEAEAKRS